MPAFTKLKATMQQSETPCPLDSERSQEDQDVRDKMCDDLIRSMIEEIDRDTIKRYERGQRLVSDGQCGYRWVYFVNDKGQVVDENGKLLDV